MTTYNGKSAIESTEQSLPDYKLYSLDSIELAIFNHDSDGCDRPETDSKYQQRKQEWANIKLFLLNHINTLDKPSDDSTEEMRREFEIDAKPYGFVLDRRCCAAPEPWSEYAYTDTGHRWAGWQAAIASKQTELNATKREQHQNQLDLLEQLTIANRIIARKQAELNAAKTDAANREEEALRLGGLNAKNIGEANAKLTALQAKIEEADKQKTVGELTFSGKGAQFDHSNYKGLNNHKYGVYELFTRPPITPQREIELLAVIEQMRSALGYYTNSSHVVYGKGRARESWEEQDDGLVAREALALTPDLSALKERSND